MTSTDRASTIALQSSLRLQLRQCRKVEDAITIQRQLADLKREQVRMIRNAEREAATA